MLNLLIAANVAVFALMAALTGTVTWSPRTLLAWGGNFGLLSLHTEPWRLLTYQYLHGNLIHILGNMVLLAITGRILRGRISMAWLFGAYTLCGVLAGALSASAHPTVVGVGASGSIAGILGIVVVFWLSRRHPDINGAWVMQTVLLNALYSAFASNVDWLAHAGGFAAGLVCGVALLAVARPPPLLELRDAR